MDNIVWVSSCGKEYTLDELENEHLYNILQGLYEMKFTTKPCKDNVEIVELLLITAYKRNIAPLHTIYNWRCAIFNGLMYRQECKYMYEKCGIKLSRYEFYEIWY